MTITCLTIAQPISSASYQYKSLYKYSPRRFHSRPNLHKSYLPQTLPWKRRLSHSGTFKAKQIESRGGEEEEKKKGKDENQEREVAVDKVLQLYTDVKNKNINKVAEVTGEDSQYMSKFLPNFRIPLGNKQVTAFLYWSMMKLGKNIKLVAVPMSKDGTTFSVQWCLELDNPLLSSAKGFSFHLNNVYHGKLLINNIDKLMDPILHMEPLRLKTIAFVVRLAEKISTYMRLGEITRKQAVATLVLLSMLLLPVAVFYLSGPRLS